VILGLQPMLALPEVAPPACIVVPGFTDLATKDGLTVAEQKEELCALERDPEVQLFLRAAYQRRRALKKLCAAITSTVTLSLTASYVSVVDMFRFFMATSMSWSERLCCAPLLYRNFVCSDEVFASVRMAGSHRRSFRRTTRASHSLRVQRYLRLFASDAMVRYCQSLDFCAAGAKLVCSPELPALLGRMPNLERIRLLHGVLPDLKALRDFVPNCRIDVVS